MRIFGHPIHPILVHFPLAFWTLGTVFDIAAYAGWPELWQPAGTLIALGLVLALIAALAGAVDYGFMEANDKARTTAEIHMMVIMGAWMIYVLAYVLRLEGGATSAQVELTPVVFSVAGFLTMSIGGLYGGKLVYHHGVGVTKQGDRSAQSKKDDGQNP